MRSDIFKYVAAFSVLVFCFQSASAQKIKVVRDADSANVLSIRKAGNLPDGDLSEKIEKDARGKSTLRESPEKIRQAFVLCVPSGSIDVTSCVQRVFVTDLGTDETYEIAGEELFIEVNRPVDNLKWITEFTLSYERWNGPHYGHRYIVDLKQMKQTSAFILSDQ